MRAKERLEALLRPPSVAYRQLPAAPAAVVMPMASTPVGRPAFPARPADPLAPVVALPRPLLARAVGDLRVGVTPLGHPVLPGPLLDLETFRVLALAKGAPKLPLVGPPKER